MLVPNRKNGLFESAALDFGEEGRKLFFGRQMKGPLVLGAKVATSPDVSKSTSVACVELDVRR